jgi:hypothetical protein
MNAAINVTLGHQHDANLHDIFIFVFLFLFLNVILSVAKQSVVMFQGSFYVALMDRHYL